MRTAMLGCCGKYPLGAALAASALSVPAAAEESLFLSLIWEAPAHCPDGEAVSKRVRAFLGAKSGSSALRARAHLSETAGGWVLNLETTQGARTWQRTLRAATCEEATEAGALILALAIDPTLPHAEPTYAGDTATPPAVEESQDPAATAGQTLLARPRSADDAVTQPQPREPERPMSVESAGLLRGPWTMRVSAGPVVDVGTLSRTAIGAGAALSARGAHFELSVLGTLLPKVRAVVARNPERGGDIGLWAVGGQACHVRGSTAASVGACLGVEAGSLSADGVGATGWNASGSASWLALRAAVHGELALAGPLAAFAAVEAGLPVTRPTFVIEGLSAVHQPSFVGGRVRTGLALKF